MDSDTYYNVFADYSVKTAINENREYVYEMIYKYMKKTMGAELIKREVAYELYHKHLVEK